MDDLDEFLLEPNSLDFSEPFTSATAGVNNGQSKPIVQEIVTQQWCSKCERIAEERESRYRTNMLMMKEKMLYTEKLLLMHEESQLSVMSQKATEPEHKYSLLKTQHDILQTQLQTLLANEEISANAKTIEQIKEKDKLISHLQDQVASLDAARRLHEQSIKAFRQNDAGLSVEVRKKSQEKISSMSAELSHQKSLVTSWKNKCARLKKQIEYLNKQRTRQRTVSGDKDVPRTSRRRRTTKTSLMSSSAEESSSTMNFEKGRNLTTVNLPEVFDESNELAENTKADGLNVEEVKVVKKKAKRKRKRSSTKRKVSRKSDASETFPPEASPVRNQSVGIPLPKSARYSVPEPDNKPVASTSAFTTSRSAQQTHKINMMPANSLDAKDDKGTNAAEVSIFAPSDNDLGMISEMSTQSPMRSIFDDQTVQPVAEIHDENVSEVAQKNEEQTKVTEVEAKSEMKSQKSRFQLMMEKKKAKKLAKAARSSDSSSRESTNEATLFSPTEDYSFGNVMPEAFMPQKKENVKLAPTSEKKHNVVSNVTTKSSLFKDIPMTSTATTSSDVSTADTAEVAKTKPKDGKKTTVKDVTMTILKDIAMTTTKDASKTTVEDGAMTTVKDDPTTTTTKDIDMTTMEDVDATKVSEPNQDDTLTEMKTDDEVSSTVIKQLPTALEPHNETALSTSEEGTTLLQADEVQPVNDIQEPLTAPPDEETPPVDLQEENASKKDEIKLKDEGVPTSKRMDVNLPKKSRFQMVMEKKRKGRSSKKAPEKLQKSIRMPTWKINAAEAPVIEQKEKIHMNPTVVLEDISGRLSTGPGSSAEDKPLAITEVKPKKSLKQHPMKLIPGMVIAKATVSVPIKPQSESNQLQTESRQPQSTLNETMSTTFNTDDFVTSTPLPATSLKQDKESKFAFIKSTSNNQKQPSNTGVDQLQQATKKLKKIKAPKKKKNIKLKSSGSEKDEIHNNEPLFDDFDEIFNNELFQYPPLVTPLKEDTFLRKEILKNEYLSQILVPEISMDVEPEYSPVVIEELSKDSIHASTSLCHAFNFESTSTTTSTGVSSPHNITKPRRFSCEAPERAVPVPTIKPAAKTYSNPLKTSPKTKDLKKTLSLPLPDTAPSHWQNTTAKPTVEKPTDGRPDDVMMNVSFSSENEFDPEQFLNELTASESLEMDPIEEMQTKIDVEEDTLQIEEEMEVKMPSTQENFVDKIESSNAPEKTNQINISTVKFEQSEHTEDTILPLQVADTESKLPKVNKTELLSPPHSQQTSDTNSITDDAMAIKLRPNMQTIRERMHTTEVCNKISSNENVTPSDSNNNVAAKPQHPKQDVVIDDSFTLQDEDLNVNLTKDMDGLIAMCVQAVKNDTQPKILDLPTLLNCVVFTITLARDHSAIVPERDLNASESIEGALPVIEAKLLRLIIILHRKKYNNSQLIQNLVLPILLRIITRHGHNFSFFQNKDDISNKAHYDEAIEKAFKSSMHGGHLSQPCTLSAVRLYTCFARAIDSTLSVVDLFQYCLLWRRQDLIECVLQSLLFWPSIFQELRTLGNCVLHQLNYWIKKCGGKRFKNAAVQEHMTWIQEQSVIDVYKGSGSNVWERLFEDNLKVLKHAQYIPAFNEAFHDVTKVMINQNIFDMNTHCAIESMNILSKEIESTSHLDGIIESNMWPILNVWSQSMVLHGKDGQKKVTNECVIAVLEAVNCIFLNYISKNRYKHNRQPVSTRVSKHFITICCLLDNFSSKYTDTADFCVQVCTASFIIRANFCDPQRAHMSLLRWFQAVNDKQKFQEDPRLLHRLSLFFNSDELFVKNILSMIDKSVKKYDGYKLLVTYMTS